MDLLSTQLSLRPQRQRTSTDLQNDMRNLNVTEVSRNTTAVLPGNAETENNTCLLSIAILSTAGSNIESRSGANEKEDQPKKARCTYIEHSASM